MDQVDVAAIRSLRPTEATDEARLAFLQQLYRLLLGRAGDEGGLAAHCAAMRGGAAPEAIVTAFLNSPEYLIREEQRAAAAEAEAAAAAVDATPTVLPPLSRWHRRGWEASRRIAFVGDSTIAHMDAGPLAAWAEAHIGPEGLLPNVRYRVFGASGNTLHEFMHNAPEGAGLADVIAYAPDLIVFCYGINDVRFGRSSREALTGLVEQAVQAFAAALPECDVVLRMPNSLLTWGANIEAPDGMTPAAAAQVYSDMLRDAYLSVAEAHPEVAHYNTRGIFFPGICRDAAFYMHDDLHPQPAFYRAFLEDLTRHHIGRAARAA